MVIGLCTALGLVYRGAAPGAAGWSRHPGAVRAAAAHGGDRAVPAAARRGRAAHQPDADLPYLLTFAPPPWCWACCCNDGSSAWPPSGR